MERFLKRHEGRITGSISGFDRILFKGSLRSICYSSGIEKWLSSRGILLVDFADYAQKLSSRIVEHAKAFAKQHSRPVHYEASAKKSKEDIVREIIQRDRVEEGLVCVLTCVEPCRTFRVRTICPKKRHIGLRSTDRPCLHIYFYFLDRDFGLMHVRLQSWIPFTVQICINGWEWLAIQMQKSGIPFDKADNCFARIDNIASAQRLMNSLIERKWIRWLNHWARLINPWINRPNPLQLHPYYWTIRECEYSTDILFRDAAALHQVYPALLSHAIHHFHARDVLHFLGRRVTTLFDHEVKTSFKFRVEGTRIKHWVEENSIKMYDKQGCVLRVETTINNPRRWKVWRRTTHKGKCCMGWIPMRKSIADLHRRAEVSRAANERYLDALSVVGESLPACKVLDGLAKRISRNGCSFRPLYPVAPHDAALLQAISSGEHLVQGVTNKKLRLQLYPASENDRFLRKKVSCQLSRKLRLLRAHGLIFRVSKSHFYRLTKKGLIAAAVAHKLRTANLLQVAA